MVRWNNLGESLTEFLIEAGPSPAAIEAEKLGYTSAGFGNWRKGKSGPVVARTDKETGKLVPVKGDASGDARGGAEKIAKKRPSSRKPADTEERPKAPKKAPAKSKFSNAAESTAGLVGKPVAVKAGGTTVSVRNLVDENGKPIDVSSTQGRKKAIQQINARQEQLKPKTIEAVSVALSAKKGDPNAVLAKKWLGELGEILALRDLLEEGVEGYFLPASASKNDLVIFSPASADSRDLKLSFVSVKSTKGGGESNGLGANIAADFKKILDSKTMSVGGQDVSAFEYADTAMKMKRHMLKFFTQGRVGRKGVSTEGINPRLLKSKPEKIDHPTSKVGFSSHVDFLNARVVNKTELDKFLTDYKDTLDKAGSIGVHLAKDLSKAIGKGITLKDLDDWLLENLGKTLDETNTVAVQAGDTMTARYAEGEGFVDIKIAIGEDVTKKTLQKAKERGLTLDDSGRPTSGVEQVTMLMGLSQRTRGIGKKDGGTAHLDGIINGTPTAKVQDIELSVPEYIDRIGFRRRTLDIPLG